MWGHGEQSNIHIYPTLLLFTNIIDKINTIKK